MVKVHFNEEPSRIKYMRLPDGVHADVRLRTNIEKVEIKTDEGEPAEEWLADEHYFRASAAYMTEEYVTNHFDELLDYEPGDQEEANTEALLLEMAADHEYRLCLLELGVEI